MDAIKFLTRQHRRMESLFARYERAPQHKREELFGLIERAIVPHAVIEEMHLYPAIRDRVANGASLSEHAIHDHAKVEEVLDEMGSTDARTADFDDKMRWVIDTVAQHVEEEEGTNGLFARLRDTMTKSELEDLGRDLRNSFDLAPTRAHPLAPDHPPLNKVLGAPVALVDRVRDRLSGRAEEAEETGEDVTRARSRGRHRGRTARSARSRRRTSSGARSGHARKRASSTRATSRPSRSRHASHGARSRGRSTTTARRRKAASRRVAQRHARAARGKARRR